MNSNIKIRPVNSVLFVSDLGGGIPPVIPNRDAMVWGTASCLSFRCFPEQDGPTEIVLGAVKDLDPGDRPIFEGELDTPSRRLIISTVEHKSVLEADVPHIRSRLRIWMSHPRWPEKVVIGFE
jgi:hypothetical protein